MKKFLLLILILPCHLYAGEWTKTVTEADELLGNMNAYTSYVYQDGNNAFVFRTDKPDQFSIVSEHVLDCRYYSPRTGIFVKVGLYDEAGVLVDSFKMFLGEWNNQCTVVGTFDCDFMSQPVGQRSNTRKIMKHLRGSVGYVRIIADTHSHGLYDLRIQPMKIEQ